METLQEVVVELQDDPPGIVIRGTFGPTPRPAIAAFIWGALAAIHRVAPDFLAGAVRRVAAIPAARPR